MILSGSTAHVGRQLPFVTAPHQHPAIPHHYHSVIALHPSLCGRRRPSTIRRSRSHHPLFGLPSNTFMAGGGEAGSSGVAVSSPTAYEEALNALSSLITRRTRADATNKGDCFDLMWDYLKILELEEPISRLNVIHVAGTKGKGSTCAFTESILRMEISEEKFLTYFCWCWDKLQEKTDDDDVPMPNYFRFLALLGFKIFSAEQVDVAIMEVGLGGKFDATNVVKAPIVCGISSLGYDHMEILGYTLGEIAGEKAGIFKQGVPAYTVPQPEEAMTALEAKASQLGISLQVASPLDSGTLKLGLDGEHQYINAGLAVALCKTWLQKTGHSEGMHLDDTGILPEQFVRLLAVTQLQGRSQIVPDPHVRMQSQNRGVGGLVFYLDGAHSPESLEACARWFSHVVKKESKKFDHMDEQHHDCQNGRQILLFNCLSVRDPQLLLPPLVNTCARHGVFFSKAIFVPNQSVFNKVGSYASPPATDPQKIDLSWQQSLQRVYENLIDGEGGVGSDKSTHAHESKDSGDLNNVKDYGRSSVLSSLPLAIKWLRDTARQNQSIHFQVLVTGSLHLIGDTLRLIKK